MLAAWPMQIVLTGALRYCIVSKMARPLVTTPPGELMYSMMSVLVLALEEQELGNDQVRDVVLDRFAEEDDPP